VDFLIVVIVGITGKVDNGSNHGYGEHGLRTPIGFIRGAMGFVERGLSFTLSSNLFTPYGLRFYFHASM